MSPKDAEEQLTNAEKAWVPIFKKHWKGCTTLALSCVTLGIISTKIYYSSEIGGLERSVKAANDERDLIQKKLDDCKTDHSPTPAQIVNPVKIPDQWFIKIIGVTNRLYEHKRMPPSWGFKLVANVSGQNYSLPIQQFFTREETTGSFPLPFSTDNYSVQFIRYDFDTKLPKRDVLATNAVFGTNDFTYTIGQNEDFAVSDLPKRMTNLLNLQNVNREVFGQTEIIYEIARRNGK